MVVEEAHRADELKTCPRCAEQVRAEAQVCRYCGHRFTRRHSAFAERLRSPLLLAVGVGIVGLGLGIFLFLRSGAVDSAEDVTSKLESIDGVISCSTPEPAGTDVQDFGRCESESGDTLVIFFFRTAERAQGDIQAGCEDPLGLGSPGITFYDPGANWYVLQLPADAGGIGDSQLTEGVADALGLDARFGC